MPAKVKSRHAHAAKRPTGPEAPTTFVSRLEAYLAGHKYLVVIAIVLLSILLRVGYFLELNAGPCIWQHRWDQSDMNFFDRWACKIAAGDWLCRSVDPPVHDWHRRIAQLHFRDHPTELADIRAAQAQTGRQIDPVQALWNKWAGRKRYYQGPLYPYLIALTYKVWADVRAVFILQLLAGIATNVLVYLVARRAFGDLVGALSGLLVCFCSPLLHYELVLLRESLVVFAAMSMVYLADLAAQRKQFGWWLAAGVFMGVSLLLKAHFGLFIIGAGLLLVIQLRGRRKMLARCAAGFAIGVLVGVAPLPIRNIAVGVPAFSTATSSKPAFALWNGYEPGAGVSWRLSAAAKVMGQTGGEGSVVWATLKTHPGPGSYIALLWAKFARALHWYELPDSANFYYYRLHSRVLRFMPVTFFALGPLGVVGLVLACRRAGRCKFLYLQVFTNLAVMVLFFPVGRFRLPALAAIAPFAALTLATLAESLATSSYRKAAILTVAVLLVGLWTAKPLAEDQPLIRLADFSVPFRVYYEPLIRQAADRGDWPRAARIANDLIQYHPDWLDEIGPTRRPSTQHQAELTRWFAELHKMCSQINQRAGNQRRAAMHFRRYRELSASLKPAVPAGLPPVAAPAGGVM